MLSQRFSHPVPSESWSAHWSPNNEIRLPPDTPSIEEGWALKKGKKSTQFSSNVRSFLYDVFLQGEETGVKANAADLALKMRSVRLANGNRLFSKEE